MDQTKIGKFIQSLRKDKNLTQVELANRIGVSDRAISKWENGRGCKLKQESTINLWKYFPVFLSKHFWNERTFWSDGYFACLIGEASPETIRRYIENQG